MRHVPVQPRVVKMSNLLIFENTTKRLGHAKEMFSVDAK